MNSTMVISESNYYVSGTNYYVSGTNNAYVLRTPPWRFELTVIDDYFSETVITSLIMFVISTYTLLPPPRTTRVSRFATETDGAP